MQEPTVIQKKCAECATEEVQKEIQTIVGKLIFEADSEQSFNPYIVHSLPTKITRMLEQIATLDPNDLRSILFEDNPDSNKGKACVTTFNKLISAFALTYLVNLKLELLGDGSLIRGVVRPDTDAEATKLVAEGLKENFGFFSHVDEQEFNLGSILGIEGWTPLINVAWMAAAIDSKHEFFLARNPKDDPSSLTLNEIYDSVNQRWRITTFELLMLKHFGYTTHVDSLTGISFQPPDYPQSIDIEKVIQVFKTAIKNDPQIIVKDLSSWLNFPTKDATPHKSSL